MSYKRGQFAVATAGVFSGSFVQVTNATPSVSEATVVNWQDKPVRLAFDDLRLATDTEISAFSHLFAPRR